MRFGLSGTFVEEDNLSMEDWKIFSDYERLQDIELKKFNVELKSYDSAILDRLNYSVKITPWLAEGISPTVLAHSKIGFYPGGDQITIPHFDIDGKFIGLRGRALCLEEAEKYGKYRPIKINKDYYNHPLGMNLYNLNNSKDNIKLIKKAIVFEGKR